MPEAVEDLPAVAPATVSYWMCSDDFFSVFKETHCLRILNNFQRAAVVADFVDRPLAGGKMHGTEALLRNPQVLLSLVQTTECVVQLQLLDRRLHGTAACPALPQRIDGSAMQLHVLRGRPTERPLTADTEPVFVAATHVLDVVDDAEARDHPTATLRLNLPGGNYVLLPTLNRASSEAFIIKVFSVSAFYMKLLN